MSYCTMSIWATTEWNDDLEAIARDKFVPMVLGAGASRVTMVHTADMEFVVFTEFTDKAASDAAAEKMTAIREKAAGELPMSMSSRSEGPVFAQG